MVITIFLSVLRIVPSDCARLTYFLHPKSREIDAVLISLKLITLTMRRLQCACGAQEAFPWGWRGGGGRTNSPPPPPHTLGRKGRAGRRYQTLLQCGQSCREVVYHSERYCFGLNEWASCVEHCRRVGMPRGRSNSGEQRDRGRTLTYQYLSPVAWETLSTHFFPQSHCYPSCRSRTRKCQPAHRLGIHGKPPVGVQNSCEKTAIRQLLVRRAVKQQEMCALLGAEDLQNGRRASQLRFWPRMPPPDCVVGAFLVGIPERLYASAVFHKNFLGNRCVSMCIHVSAPCLPACLQFSLTCAAGVWPNTDFSGPSVCPPQKKNKCASGTKGYAPEEGLPRGQCSRSSRASRCRAGVARPQGSLEGLSRTGAPAGMY